MRFRFQNKTIFYWMVKVAILIILMAGFCFGLFVFEYKGVNNKIANRFPQLSFIVKLPKILDIFYLPYRLSGTSLPVYNVVVNPQDFKDLEDALAKNPAGSILLLNKYRKVIPAEFIYNNQSYQAKIRVRGDFGDHWLHKKKSWQIIFDDSNLFEGKKKINLTLPETRSFISEHISNYRAKKIGLARPESRFVILKINGRQPAIYFETEAFAKEFLEKSELPDGANLYGENDNLAYQDYNHDLLESPAYWRKYTQDKQSQIDNFAEIDLLGKLLYQGSGEEFYKKIPTIIDMDNFYKWQAHSVLMGSTHQCFTHNVRLYFNISRGKFEFIPWDLRQYDRDKFIDLHYNSLISRILGNPEFLHQRNKVLWDYVKDDANLKDDLEFYDKIYQEVRSAFYKDRIKAFSNFYFDRKITNKRNLLIQQYRNIQNALKSNQVLATIRISPQIIKIGITTKGFSDILLNLPKESFYYDENQNNVFDSRDIKITDSFQMSSQREIPEGFSLEEEIRILPTDYTFFIEKADFNPDDFEIEVTNAVTGSKIKPVIRYVDEETFKYFEQINYSREEFLRDNPIFKKGFSDNQIVLYPGIYQISETIIVPKGFSLEIKPGSQLKFAPGASLISYGPVKAQGINQAPIIFTAQDRNKGWGVVAVLDIEKSIFEHCLVEYGGEAYINGVFFSGQLAIHYADAEIKNCRFRFAQGDDSLNIKKGRVNLENNYFYQNNFDGLDLDWANGRVANNHFLDNGNDGLDLGGVGNLIVWSNRIEGSKDKCLSIGENSKNTRVVNNLLMNCQTGIAVKDNSEVDIINNTILNKKN